VEGYLACHAAKLKDGDGSFSKPPSDYIGEITQAYSEQTNASKTNEEKAGMRIGSVLHRFKDPESPPAKPAS